MNTEQADTVNAAQEEVRQIRHTLGELSNFGWKASEPTKALQAFDKLRAQLGRVRAAIDDLDPLAKDHAQKLKSLLSEEHYSVETLAKLASEARAALTDEELAFFDARDGSFAALAEDEQAADGQIENGLAWLIEGLQSKWGVMLKKRELAQRMQDISAKHNTPESFGAGAISLPKPFAKMGQAIWPAFVASFFGRVLTVLPNHESSSPSDVVKTVFER